MKKGGRSLEGQKQFRAAGKEPLGKLSGRLNWKQ